MTANHKFNSKIVAYSRDIFFKGKSSWQNTQSRICASAVILYLLYSPLALPILPLSHVKLHLNKNKKRTLSPVLSPEKKSCLLLCCWSAFVACSSSIPSLVTKRQTPAHTLATVTLALTFSSSTLLKPDSIMASLGRQIWSSKNQIYITDTIKIKKTAQSSKSAH